MTAMCNRDLDKIDFVSGHVALMEFDFEDAAPYFEVRGSQHNENLE